MVKIGKNYDIKENSTRSKIVEETKKIYEDGFIKEYSIFSLKGKRKIYNNGSAKVYT